HPDVLENTHRHLGMGKAPAVAAADATSELTLPVIVATLALIIVLCPVALTPGVSGFLFKPLTMAVAFAMLASFLLSWTFVPSLCSKLLRRHGHGHSEEEHAHRDEQPAEPAEERKGVFGRLHQGIDGFL